NSEKLPSLQGAAILYAAGSRHSGTEQWTTVVMGMACLVGLVPEKRASSDSPRVRHSILAGACAGTELRTAPAHSRAAGRGAVPGEGVFGVRWVEVGLRHRRAQLHVVIHVALGQVEVSVVSRLGPVVVGDTVRDERRGVVEDLDIRERPAGVPVRVRVD